MVCCCSLAGTKACINCQNSSSTTPPYPTYEEIIITIKVKDLKMTNNYSELPNQSEIGLGTSWQIS